MNNRASKFLVVIILVAFFLRIHGINYYFYGDEHGHVYNSLGLATGQLPGNFHRIALFLFYGLFYAVGWVIGIFRSPIQFIETYFSNMHLFYYVGRFFEVLTGTASVVFLYLLGKRLFSRSTGLAAALFLAASPVAVEISQKARGQALCLLLSIAAMYFAFLAIEKKRKFFLFLISGFCVGAAYSIRLFAAIVIIPVIYFYVESVLREQRSRDIETGGYYNRLKALILNASPWAFVFGALLAFYVSDPVRFMNYPERMAVTLSTISVGSADPVLYLGVERANALRHYLTVGFPRLLGYPLYIFTAIAFLIGLFRFKKPYYLLLILTSIAYVAIMGRGSIAAPRYLIPIYPMLFLISAEILAAGSRLISKTERAQTALCLGAAFFLSLPLLQATHRQNYENRQTTTMYLAREWLLSNFPSGTRIAVESMGYFGPDLKLIPVIDYWIYNLSREELEKLLEERVREGQPSIALRYFIDNPPSPKFYTTSISIREIVDIEQLKEEKYQYIVTNSGNRGIYESEITRERYPEHYRARKKFYSWLEEEGELIKVFSPDETTPGHEIQVYRIGED